MNEAGSLSFFAFFLLAQQCPIVDMAHRQDSIRFKAEDYSVVYLQHIFFIYQLNEDYDCFHFLDIVNSAVDEQMPH